MKEIILSLIKSLDIDRNRLAGLIGTSTRALDDYGKMNLTTAKKHRKAIRLVRLHGFVKEFGYLAKKEGWPSMYNYLNADHIRDRLDEEGVEYDEDDYCRFDYYVMYRPDDEEFLRWCEDKRRERNA